MEEQPDECAVAGMGETALFCITNRRKFRSVKIRHYSVQFQIWELSPLAITSAQTQPSRDNNKNRMTQPEKDAPGSHAIGSSGSGTPAFGPKFLHLVIAPSPRGLRDQVADCMLRVLVFR